MMQHAFKIKTPAEFSYDFSLAFLTRSAKEPMHIVRDRVVRKLIRVGNDRVLFQVSEGKDNLHVEIISQGHEDHVKEHVKDYVREWFDLGTDLTPFYTLAKKDDVLKRSKISAKVEQLPDVI